MRNEARLLEIMPLPDVINVDLELFDEAS